LNSKGDREVGTEDKIVCLACEDGYLRIYSVRSRKQVSYFFSLNFLLFVYFKIYFLISYLKSSVKVQ